MTGIDFVKSSAASPRVGEFLNRRPAEAQQAESEDVLPLTPQRSTPSLLQLPNNNSALGSSSVPYYDNDRINRQPRHHLNVSPAQRRGPSSNRHDPPSRIRNAPDSDSQPSSRATVLAFLLFFGVAIVHAIASGFERMHGSKHQPTQMQQEGPIGDISQGYHIVEEITDDAFSFTSSSVNMANNEVVYDNRSVNANSNREPSPEEDAASGATATILSRTSQLASLISNLDASDVVECYVVTRMAHLSNVASTGGGGGSAGGNSGNRRIQRMLDESKIASSSADTMESKAEETEPSDTASSSAATTATNIPSGPVLIRKSALAFRYRPRVASASHGPHFSEEYSSGSNVPLEGLSPIDQVEQQKYFELTLEYGPQRTGASRTSESMPMVHMDMEVMGEMSNGNIGKYVSWENVGRVYHSTHIGNEWTEAYYMASITGVVFEKIIQRAVEYTYKRPRYQPFEVVSIPSRSLILRSSGSDDFVWEMFRDLADLYVDIDPILVPPRGRVQFYVADPAATYDGQEKEGGRRESGNEGTVAHEESKLNDRAKRHQLNPNVKKVQGPLEGSRAAVFYENFFNCANAIKTGDYSMYLPPPSSAPTFQPTESTAPSMAPSIMSEVNETSGDNISKLYAGGTLDADEQGGIPEAPSLVETITSDIPPHDDHAMFNSTGNVDYGENNTLLDESNESQLHYQSNGTGSLRHRYLTSGDTPHLSEEHLSENLNATTAVLSETNPDGGTLVEENDDFSDKSLSDDDLLIDSSDTKDTESSKDDPAEVAEKAAIEAAKAADNAAAVVATNTSSAADTAAATSEAAKAAKKAKDASVAARSKQNAEALLSGDGDLMTSVLSSCFSDPKYGIRTHEEVHYGMEYAEGNENIEGGDDKESGNHAEMRDNTLAYIYLDGDIFFRLNLTSPFWGVVSDKDTSVPPPHLKPEGKGDAIDWGIFLLILMGTLFGFLVLMHQVGIVIDKRFQFRHFFHPTMTEADWAAEEGGSDNLGGGFLHRELGMTVESIPMSMGGSDEVMPPTQIYHDYPDSRSSTETAEVDLEMATRNSSNRVTMTNTSSPRFNLGDSETTTNELPGSLKLKRDTPDLVERPSSRSWSKVALPRISPISTGQIDARTLKFNESAGAPRLPLDDS